MPDSYFPRYDSNSASVTVDISNAFATFLLYDECGPKISNDTATLLWSYGIDNQKELVVFSQLSIPKMLIGFPLQELENIRASDFIKLILYGEYFKIKKSLMIPTASLVDSAAFDPIEFRSYKWIRQKAVRTKFYQTFMKEYMWRLDFMMELNHFDETNTMVQCDLSMNECSENHDPPIVSSFSHSCPIPETVPDDTMSELPPCFDAQDHMDSSNPILCFPPFLTHHTMIDDSRRVTPSKVRGLLPSFVSCPSDPMEGAGPGSDTDVGVSRKGEGTLMMDIPHNNPITPTPTLSTQNTAPVFTQLTYTELRGDNDELDKFYDANSDWVTGEELDKFYDANSDWATGEDLFFFLDALDDPSIDKSHNYVQFHADGVETESIFPPEPLDKPIGEKNQRTPMRSKIRHIWSLLSMDFLKMRQVKFKIFKHVYIPILHHVLSGLLPMRDPHTEKGDPNSSSFCTLINDSMERGEPPLNLTNDYNKERMQFSGLCLGECIYWKMIIGGSTKTGSQKDPFVPSTPTEFADTLGEVHSIPAFIAVADKQMDYTQGRITQVKQWIDLTPRMLKFHCFLWQRQVKFKNWHHKHNKTPGSIKTGESGEWYPFILLFTSCSNMTVIFSCNRLNTTQDRDATQKGRLMVRWFSLSWKLEVFHLSLGSECMW